MALGIFNNTMGNMKWPEIQSLVNQNAVILLPLGVIEEHGPQLSLGTDIYTAHIHCLFIQKKLAQKGLTAAIAPPFYWGVCQSTGSFIGSFKIRKETARALLFDILASLADFGFKNIVGINAHGDIDHQVAILEAFKEATEKLGVNAGLAFPQHLIPHYGLKGDEPYIYPVRPQAIQVSSSKVPDVHGGDIETAVMHQFYPDLTDTNIARSLPPVALADDQVWTWLLGGHTQSLSAEGYCGSPADYETVDVINHIDDITERVTDAVLERLSPS